MPNIQMITRVLQPAVTSEDASTTAWVNAVVGAGGSVGTAQRGYVNTLITAYKSAGVWTLLDREWLYASENATQASIDIVSLSTHTATNSPTFTANQGYEKGAGAGYINTGYAGGANFTLNANCFGCYVRNSRTAGGTSVEMGVNDGGNGISYLRPRNASNLLELDDNGTAFPTLSNANAQGSYTVVRTSSSSITLYKNGSSVGSVTSNTIGTGTTINWFVLGYNNGGSLNSNSVDQVAAAFMGGTLDATKAAAKDAALNAYMTSIGANVY